jgi:hypothetical protein
MQIALIIALSLHVLSSVFWAGSSFTLARTGGAGGSSFFVRKWLRPSSPF